VQPDEIYNLAAQSHVAVSFEEPEYTANADAIGALRILEAIRISAWKRRPASTRPAPPSSTAWCRKSPQKETTPFYPRSPYAVAKLYAYWITVNYREAYGMYACNGILFNHESPMRGETFVTRKITRALARIARPAGLPVPGQHERCATGATPSDYVEMQWLMLQQDQPKTSSSPPACNTACASSSSAAAELGITLRFEGEGVEEVGIVEAITGNKAKARWAT
jgi:GDPmannose 4,6-dehydratase